jgi:signal transduction histidine kinase
MTLLNVWEQEGFAYAVLRALPALIVVIDRHGKIVAANAAWEAAAYEAGSAELAQTTIGRNYLEACRQGAAAGAPGAQVALEGLEAVLDGSLPLFTLEYPCPLESETRWYLLYGAPLEGHMGGAVVAHIDITQQKQLELQLRQSREELSAFLNLVGHELSSPLTSIQGHLQLALLRLHRVLPSQAPQETILAENLAGQLAPLLDSLERAKAQAGKLNRLIGDLLEVARMQAHHLKLSLVKVDLVNLIRETLEELRLLWPNRTLVFAAPDDAVEVKLDVGRIEQAIINYVTNALKYSPVDRPVKVALHIAERQAVVRVEDQGPGLYPEELGRIWERFYRVSGTEARQEQGMSGGLGLGLSICRGIVQEHGGQVGVESAPGQGATFWFTLPLHA